MLSIISVSGYLKNISIRLVQSAKWYEIGSSGAVNSPALVTFFWLLFPISILVLLIIFNNNRTFITGS